MEDIFMEWLQKKHNGILPVFKDRDSARNWCFEAHKEIFIANFEKTQYSKTQQAHQFYRLIGDFMMNKLKDVYTDNE